MTGVTVLGVSKREWSQKKYNLCEVCFKPFNLANIDMHLEAGCAAEIKERYEPVMESPKGPEVYIEKMKSKKIFKKKSALGTKQSVKKTKKFHTK